MSISKYLVNYMDVNEWLEQSEISNIINEIEKAITEKEKAKLIDVDRLRREEDWNVLANQTVGFEKSRHT